MQRIYKTLLAVALGGMTVLSCSPDSTGPRGGDDKGTLRFSASVANSAVEDIVVTVTASDLSDTLVWNFDVVAGEASGQLEIPAGSEREIVVNALDGGGIETHRADTVVTIVEGLNDEIRLVLEPLLGDQPIVVTLASVTITLSPADTTITVGDSAMYSATVLDASGNDITTSVSLTWASTNPTVARIDGDGTVTGVAPDTASIVAVYRGSAGATGVTVESGPISIITTQVIAYHSDRDGDVDLYAMDADGGNRIQLIDDPGIDGSPDWSPDGLKMLFDSDRDGDRDVYVLDLVDSTVTQLTNEPGLDSEARWSPDGSTIVYRCNNGGQDNICLMNADGTGKTDLTQQVGPEAHPDWSPDGTQLVFTRNLGSPGFGQIHVMNADGSGISNISDGTGVDGFPSWSPDGTKVLFNSGRVNGTLNPDIFLMNIDGTNVVQLTNTPAAAEQRPRWSPDGSKIAFQTTRVGGSEIFLMNADGSAATNITNDPAGLASSAAWKR